MGQYACNQLAFKLLLVGLQEYSTRRRLPAARMGAENRTRIEINALQKRLGVVGQQITGLDCPKLDEYKDIQRQIREKEELLTTHPTGKESTKLTYSKYYKGRRRRLPASEQ